VDPTNQRSTGFLMWKGDKEVVIDITNTPKGIPKGGHTTFQVHYLPEIIGDLKWMN
jgi:hypothetical protein